MTTLLALPPQRGQIVDFHHVQPAPLNIHEVWPAIVVRTAVADSPTSALDLVVFNPHNGASPMFSVPAVSLGAPHYWTWPDRPSVVGVAPVRKQRRQRVRESAALAEEAGARHSASDQSRLDEAHDAIVAAGARCPVPAPTQEAAEPPLVETPTEPGVVICTYNVGLVAYLMSEGLVPEGTPVLDQPTAAGVTGQVVWSDNMLPLELAVLAAQIAIIPLNLPADMQSWPVNLEEIRALAQPPKFYQVRDVTPTTAPTPVDPATQEAARDPGTPSRLRDATGSRDPHRRPLTESAAPVREAVAPDGFDSARGVLTFTIIRPGFNTSRSRYYTPAGVAAIAEAMRGVKMYADHASPTELRERPERSITGWVSQITETWVADDGRAVGRATITDPAFLARARRLADTGLLSQLGASINAIGIGEDAVLEGAATFRVDAIEADDPFRSVDWVTEPGAGGRAELLEATAAGRPAGTAPTKETTMDQETPAAAPDADAAQDTARDQAIAALQQGQAQLTQQVQQIADLVNQVINAAGLDSLLAQVQGATEALKARVKTKLLAQPGPYTEAAVREALTAEVRDAAAVLGARSGVVGFGAGPDPAEPVDAVATLRETMAAHGVDTTALDAALRERLGE